MSQHDSSNDRRGDHAGRLVSLIVVLLVLLAAAQQSRFDLQELWFMAGRWFDGLTTNGPGCDR